MPFPCRRVQQGRAIAWTSNIAWAAAQAVLQPPLVSPVVGTLPTALPPLAVRKQGAPPAHTVEAAPVRLMAEVSRRGSLGAEHPAGSGPAGMGCL